MKSELIRTDSNIGTDIQGDYTSNNVSIVQDPEDQDEEDMGEFLMSASNAELGFLKQSLTNFKDMMAKEAEALKKTQNHVDLSVHKESDEEDYKDDFEEIDEEISLKDANNSDQKSDEDSIEEDLHLDEVDEDNDSDSEAEKQMEKFDNKKDKSMKNMVIEALLEENKKVGHSDTQKNKKADTQTRRPFTSVVPWARKVQPKERNAQFSAWFKNKREDCQVESITSNTDFGRQDPPEKPQSTHFTSPPSEDQFRKGEILTKIDRLNEVQKQQLLFLLEQMEKGETLDKINLSGWQNC